MRSQGASPYAVCGHRRAIPSPRTQFHGVAIPGQSAGSRDGRVAALPSFPGFHDGGEPNGRRAAGEHPCDGSAASKDGSGLTQAVGSRGPPGMKSGRRVLGSPASPAIRPRTGSSAGTVDRDGLVAELLPVVSWVREREGVPGRSPTFEVGRPGTGHRAAAGREDGHP